MRHAVVSATIAVLSVGVLLAGCTAKSDGGEEDFEDVLRTPDDFHGIRGVVVDETIRPIEGAAVRVSGAGVEAATTTNADGAFTVPDLQPGTYFLEASHPLYDTVQQTTEVGESLAPIVKVQLTRLIFANPYTQFLAFDGFLVCSIGFSVYASEECGEGVGVPCEVPVVGCQRLGGQDDNKAQFDFYTDGGFARSMVLEMTWEPTSETLKEFYFISATEWTCDPFCIGNELNLTTGGAPLYQTIDVFNGTASGPRGAADVTAETRFSTFVWPNWGSGDPEQLNIAINQDYEVFVAISYYVPLPVGWSFIEGDELPF